MSLTIEGPPPPGGYNNFSLYDSKIIFVNYCRERRETNTGWSGLRSCCRARGTHCSSHWCSHGARWSYSWCGRSCRRYYATSYAGCCTDGRSTRSSRRSSTSWNDGHAPSPSTWNDDARYAWKICFSSLCREIVICICNFYVKLLYRYDGRSSWYDDGWPSWYVAQAHNFAIFSMELIIYM